MEPSGAWVPEKPFLLGPRRRALGSSWGPSSSAGGGFVGAAPASQIGKLSMNQLDHALISSTYENEVT